MHAGVREVQSRAFEPRRPGDPPRIVENGVPVSGQRKSEVVSHGAPEAIGLFDGHAVEGAVVDAVEVPREPNDVRLLELLGRRGPA